MPSTTLTISKITPAEGNKSGKIVGTNGESISAYANVLTQLRVGGTYEIEYDTREWNGRAFKNLKSFSERPDAAASIARSVAESAAQNTHRQTDPTDAERMWCCAVLTAFIKAGEVKNDKEQVWRTVTMLRNVWKHQFGEGATEIGNQTRQQLKAVAH